METCSDNRFLIIEAAKEHLLNATNIDTSQDEMKVIDSFLFRCWQMGWLKQYEKDGLKPEQISAMMAHNTALIEQLAEYEDLEEKDLLLRLPYPIGTKCVYWACKEDRMVYYLDARKIMPKKFNPDGKLFYRIDDYIFTMDDFGKIVFLKELDAELALKKMLEEK